MRALRGPAALAITLALAIVALGLVAGLMHPQYAYGYPHKVTRWTPTLKAACVHYHLSRSDAAWLVAKVPGIIYRESRGNTYTGHVKGCLGLLQFSASFKHPKGKGWAPGHHHRDWRRCGTCSIYRLVWGFKHSSGRPWVRSTWIATIR